MPEWLSYSPEDLLMFSARTYFRLFELHNRALWPWQVAALAAGATIVWIAWRPRRGGARLAAGLLAAAWLTVAGSYLWLRFATIHTGGRAIAVGFAVEAALLVWTGVVRGSLDLSRAAGVGRWLGGAALLYGVAGQPFLAPLLGRPWAQAELFGVAPDPTVAATLGVLLLARRAPWLLWIVPVAWSLFSGMTLFAMDAPEWWTLPALALAAPAVALATRRSGARDAD